MLRNCLKSAALAALIILSLVACTSITPAGLMAASRLDPLHSNASDIAVAVGVPDTVQLRDGDAQFHISFVSDAQTLSETVPLQVRPSSRLGPEPSSDQETVYIARFAPEDAARVSAVQARVKALRAAGVEGSGTISIGVVGGCATVAPITTLPVSTWLKTDPEGEFVRLTRTRDVLRALEDDDATALKNNLKKCD